MATGEICIRYERQEQSRSHEPLKVSAGRQAPLELAHIGADLWDGLSRGLLGNLRVLLGSFCFFVA